MELILSFRSCEYTLLPGCLSHTNDHIAKQGLQLMLQKDKKTAVNFIDKQITELAEKSNLLKKDTKKDLKFSHNKLKENVQLFSSETELFSKNSGLIQQGLAVVETLSHKKYSHFDKLLSLSKHFVQALGDEDETPPFTQILQLLRTRTSQGVSIEDVLSLLVYLSSLAGSEALPPALHYSLTNTISQAILEDKNALSDSVLSLVNRDVDEISALKTSQCITERLQGIAVARDHLTTYKRLLKPGDDIEPSTVYGLLEMLIRDCLTRSQSDSTDLEYKSAGLKDLIKSGFSLFVNVSKPMPRDAAVMLVVVIGGITPGEVKMVESLVDELQPQCDVVLASSHLTYPSDVITNALSQNKLLSQV